MNVKRDASKLVLRFHRGWLRFLLNASLQTQRRVAHELATIEEASRGYLDGEIFKLLLRHLEHAIQDIGKTDWSVKRSRNDLRGRTRRATPARERIRVDARIQKELYERLLPPVGEAGFGEPAGRST